ncbi:protein mono-ADP-ribosyltransferase PARP3 [Paramormyrops kingsleyae]|uniref:Poly [ADP-ribose] polymerase n=1 Tax=Paramormyrops kingsleyae TaxID=1676925 RepID=A0A3B3RM86_9TELE|nr:poly [ADP-ribose] polymerase 3 [Paramormyrops kingsleyae]
MAPKRKAASATKAGGKKVKEESSAPKDAFRTAKEALMAAAPQEKSQRKADTHFEREHMSAQVYGDYDCMLNQTNIGQNNNKFYVIQVLQTGHGEFYCWTRWGRVGEIGASAAFGGFSSPKEAIEIFEKKFKDKTKNKWGDRERFVSHPGKYTLIEVDGDQDAEVKMDVVDEAGGRVVKNILPCTLDKSTQRLIELIFSNDMFTEAMECMNLDIKKMPLGKLSKAQIAKGFEVLEELEEALKKKSRKTVMEELSSKFYTIIPHNFGRQKPPVIDTSDILEKKKEMLLVLADIEIAQGLKAETEKAKEEAVEDVPHPADQNYLSLNCNLSLLGKDTKEYKIIETYLMSTGESNLLQLIDVWKVDRDKEAERFQEHDALGNRRLLWHGTNVAVVAAILKSGLRIMPQSGGRVGRGIYFASENRKSACYVRPSRGTGVMFLNEVCLGREHTIQQDNSRLTCPPARYDSVVARGRMEPDASKDISITLDGKSVTVPQGAPLDQPEFKNSYFDNSEYLIYKESQCRIRYLLELKFPY